MQRPSEPGCELNLEKLKDELEQYICLLFSTRVNISTPSPLSIISASSSSADVKSASPMPETATTPIGEMPKLVKATSQLFTKGSVTEAMYKAPEPIKEEKKIVYLLPASFQSSAAFSTPTKKKRKRSKQTTDLGSPKQESITKPRKPRKPRSKTPAKQKTVAETLLPEDDDVTVGSVSGSGKMSKRLVHPDLKAQRISSSTLWFQFDETFGSLQGRFNFMVGKLRLHRDRDMKDDASDVHCIQIRYVTENLFEIPDALVETAAAKTASLISNAKLEATASDEPSKLSKKHKISGLLRQKRSTKVAINEILAKKTSARFAFGKEFSSYVWDHCQTTGEDAASYVMHADRHGFWITRKGYWFLLQNLDTICPSASWEIPKVRIKLAHLLCHVLFDADLNAEASDNSKIANPQYYQCVAPQMVNRFKIYVFSKQNKTADEMRGLLLSTQQEILKSIKQEDMDSVASPGLDPGES